MKKTGSIVSRSDSTFRNKNTKINYAEVYDTMNQLEKKLTKLNSQAKDDYSQFRSTMNKFTNGFINRMT